MEDSEKGGEIAKDQPLYKRNLEVCTETVRNVSCVEDLTQEAPIRENTSSLE